MFHDLFTKLIRLRKSLKWIIESTPLRSQFGYCANNATVIYPLRINVPNNFYLYENTRLMQDLCIINSHKEKVIIKKYSAIAARTTIVTNNHTSTVTIPHFILGPSHINDKSSDIIIEEDCWVGTGVTLLAGSHLGRGCIVGAGSMVNKKIPPYAVVAGCPAKIIAVKFSIPQIIEHEEALYPEKERFSLEYLHDLFETYFEGKKVFGTSDGIDKQAIETIKKVKQQLHYVEPSI